MPRRPATPVAPPAPFKYQSVAECENAGNETQGYHLVHPRTWPPKRTSTTEEPNVALSCEHCNCVCIVYEGNDPEQSGIKIVMPEPRKKAGQEALR